MESRKQIISGRMLYGVQSIKWPNGKHVTCSMRIDAIKQTDTGGWAWAYSD